MENHTFIEKMLNRKCQRCGYHEFRGVIQTHHINHDKTNNEDNNLVALCSNCHDGLHYGLWCLDDIGIEQTPITPKHYPKRPKIDIDWEVFDAMKMKYTPLSIIAKELNISEGYLQIKMNERKE